MEEKKIEPKTYEQGLEEGIKKGESNIIDQLCSIIGNLGRSNLMSKEVLIKLVDDWNEKNGK